MQLEISLLILSVVFIIIFSWSFKKLPKENMQILACIPIRKLNDEHWHCINITYYGFITCIAYGLSIVTFFFLTASKGVPARISLFIVFTILFFTVPASKIVAKLVEKKKNRFSVGAASFVGVLLIPFVTEFAINFFSNLNQTINYFFAIVNALAISYCIGEGIGRLACISFGCCYGKQIDHINLPLRFLFKKLKFEFYGKTKKISYESGLEGKPVIAVQAITAVLYSFLALVGSYLFFNNSYILSLVLVFFPSQLWRFLSEFLRADYRGEGKISHYQIMTVISMCYMALIIIFSDRSQIPVIETDYTKGLTIFFNGYVVTVTVITSLYIFILTGISKVTKAEARFIVASEKK